MQEAVKGKYDLNNKYLLFETYNAHNRFYIKILNLRGIKTDFKDWNKLEINDQVILYQPGLKDYLKAHYVFTQRTIKDEIIECKIISKI